VQTVSFWQAWGLWFDGQSVAGYRLWGLPVLWWGRIGKLAQFTGGLAAIIDIVGIARISAWGERLRALSIERQRRTFADTWRRTRHIYRQVLGSQMDDLQRYAAAKRPGVHRSVPRRRKLEPEARRVRWISDIAFWVLAALGAALAIWHDNTKEGGPPDLPWYWTAVLVVGALALVFTWYYLVSALVTGLSLVANLVARAWPLAVYGLFVRPPLLLLRGPQPDRSLRVIGVLLVVAGFALDLLAS
jgi:hypothetical protein